MTVVVVGLAFVDKMFTGLLSVATRLPICRIFGVPLFREVLRPSLTVGSNRRTGVVFCVNKSSASLIEEKNLS